MYISLLLTPIKSKKGKRTMTKSVLWTTPERKVMFSAFGNHLKTKSLPKANECLEVRNTNPILRRRTAETMKTFISNINLGKIKKLRNRYGMPQLR